MKKLLPYLLLIAAAGAPASNLVYHGGPLIANAHVVYIFWGASWTTTGGDRPIATELQSYRSSPVAMLAHTGMLVQYNAGQSNFHGQADVFDPTNPSATAVTDAMVKAEIKKYFHGTYDAKAVYEVCLPRGYYSISGGSTSCGGPNVAYCTYHSTFTDGTEVRYTVQPFPSCSGCQATGFNASQNEELFVIHSSREMFIDPDHNGWFDPSGIEGDDLCLWGPAPFLEHASDGHTYGYQDEWSNSAGGCVR
ncbi:MAG TPA: hypothetical protein VEZ11_10635 [Thermoanaerobaculia bacterium]|nr:hypothetical protein [Thermoanaerobaculia bacterium]